MDPITLTNQPETRAIPPPLSSRVVGCWGVVVEHKLMSKSRPKWTNRRYSCLAEMEAAMTPLGESALTLGVDALSVVEKQRPKVWTISAITIRRAHRKFC